MYHSVTSSPITYIADTAIPVAKEPVYSADFTYAAASDGIYTYVGTAYTLAKAAVFKKNKKIWTTPKAVIVFSWDDANAAQKVSYSVQAFSIVSTTYTIIDLATIVGISDVKEP